MNGNVNFADNSSLIVSNISNALAIGGTVTFGSNFGIANLLGINWDSLELNTPYTLIETTQTFSALDINNFGSANAANVGLLGRQAYFQNGSLSLVVIPEPATALLSGMGLLVIYRRRRASVHA